MQSTLLVKVGRPSTSRHGIADDGPYVREEFTQASGDVGLGSLEPSSSAWASRVHLVLKPPPNQTAELADLKDCKLRPCGDYRLVNTQIDKIAPNLPAGVHQLEQASGYRMYFEADSVACYNSFRLAPGISREALAVWTPIGLLQPTVLPFGQKNSGTEAQGPYLLAAKKLRQVSNYVDDWLGFADEFSEVTRQLRIFLGRMPRIQHHVEHI